ncbi:MULTISPECIES: gluconate 2-dehydrogenase subunit 3 family protein [Jeotgalicoccus]|uniref:gluconate 2-dehydrogenase subunit 3 family protein n=1 Tax=Jeotgalicoccus TaxID=227979 RepID=UPI00041C5E97|nr:MULTISPECIES: gluconate 2-dehydrogenase subunit 3 family protein [Jeotgalicoccus]QQD85898.1 gluconate 2-dehydrogenase subunit 3 family protein [Jeotgalicoccus sp. ATCC 8456]
MANKKGSEKEFSRRDFLKTTGAATGGIIGGSLLGGLVGFNLNDSSGSESQTSEDTASEESSGSNGGTTDNARMFFHNDTDFDTVTAAMERIFPESDVGPGAEELGCAYYLDGQLMGQYGFNSKEYMQGPFEEALPTQGYQSNLNRRDYFMLGIRKLNEEANSRHDANFADLEAGQMDEILTDFQEGNVDLDVPSHTATSSYFFTMLRSATIEGAYADPVYRGNRDMAGWKMKQFPGHQMSYIQYIEDDEFHEIEPLPVYGMGH